ncbi:MAG: VTC domain-containing protein, partial [Treponema sp.]|nr:VTC domain-containing protein [Candidatus Treponema equi]
RVPFVYHDGNVRITFDRNIRSSDCIEKFFDQDCPFRPILENETNMMEVKFDELLPDFINESLQTGRLNQTSFSKYYLCRKYNMRSTL